MYVSKTKGWHLKYIFVSMSSIRILLAFEIVNPPSPEMDVLYETPEREKCLLSRHFIGHHLLFIAISLSLDFVENDQQKNRSLQQTRIYCGNINSCDKCILCEI